jgi:hypothetical protein
VKPLTKSPTMLDKGKIKKYMTQNTVSPNKNMNFIKNITSNDKKFNIFQHLFPLNTESNIKLTTESIKENKELDDSYQSENDFKSPPEKTTREKNYFGYTTTGFSMESQIYFKRMNDIHKLALNQKKEKSKVDKDKYSDIYTKFKTKR